MDKRVFLAVSVIVVLLMYLVPYLVLSGIAGPATFLFWVILSAMYLVFVYISFRR
jgi:hypothetical protein